ncbi:HTH-like domain-containing protein [Rhodovulum sp. DZ06]|uniref:HTH-like domain-containing protein n=1 Tax=Rhodovulum sp. DZ06 TaxID=3425126 RepID=UPI003D339671
MRFFAMNFRAAILSIKDALEGAPRNAYTAELHLQIIKHADDLEGVSGREFCEALGIAASYTAEFTKMKKIAPRLRRAGLDVERI